MVFWTDAEALKVYDRVFDSKDRYDLASIVISPYLLVPDKDETRMVSNNQSNQLVVDFRSTETPTKLGGVVYGRQELPEGTYTVWRDIYVRKNAELKLARKTTLKFAPSVGIMVQGKITVEGEKSDDAQKVCFLSLWKPNSLMGCIEPLRVWNFNIENILFFRCFLQLMKQALVQLYRKRHFV